MAFKCAGGITHSGRKELTDAIEQLRKFSAEQGLYLPEPHEEERLRYYANEVEKQSNYL